MCKAVLTFVLLYCSVIVPFYAKMKIVNGEAVNALISPLIHKSIFIILKHI